MDNKEKILHIIEKIKQIENLRTDGRVAKILGLSKGALSNYKRRGTVPLKKLSVYCEDKGIPLDAFLAHREKKEIREESEEYRIPAILKLLEDDPEGAKAVYHFLEAKKNFDRASRSMKRYIGKKLESGLEFPGGVDEEEKKP